MYLYVYICYIDISYIYYMYMCLFTCLHAFSEYILKGNILKLRHDSCVLDNNIHGRTRFDLLFSVVLSLQRE